MALTRAQLLMGDASQGTVLSGQVQGVKYGTGISIAVDGTISVNSQTVIGVMKLGQTPVAAAGAYNGYNWPSSGGIAGQQLQTDGSGGLTWETAAGTDWTSKGQLVVGTGVRTDTLLNVGANGQILIADSTTITGLTYTSNYVATTGATGAAIIPVGTTGQRPSILVAGDFRYNTTSTQLEFYDGSNWLRIPASTGGVYVEATSTIGSAVMPSGTSLQRDVSPALGYTRFNTNTSKLEVYGGVWETLSSSTGGLFVSETSLTGSAVLPVGSQAQRDVTPISGYFRFNNSNSTLEFYSGTTWLTVSSFDPATLSGYVAQTAAAGAAIMPSGATGSRPSSPSSGYTRFSTTNSTLEFWNGTAWSLVPSSTTGLFVDKTSATGSAVMPVGTVLQRDITPVAGYTRFNTTSGYLEVYTGVSWTSVGTPPTAGLGLILSGGALKVSISTTTTPPTAGTAQAEAEAGSLYWDSSLGALFIRYNDGTNTQWVQATPSGSSTAAASLSEAATGTLNTVYSSPQTSVAKDASGTTGAAIVPAGTTLQRPSSLVTGMLRYNSTLGYEEVYAGALRGWQQLEWRITPSSLSSYTAVNGATLPSSGTYSSITIPAGVTVYASSLTKLSATDSITISGTINGDGLGAQTSTGSITTNNGGQTAIVGAQGRGPGGGVGYGGNPSKAYSFLTFQSSSGAGGALTVYGATSVAGSTGGAGGAVLVLECDGPITVGSSAIISMNGSQASPVSGSGPGVGVGGGGGGSGGLILLQSTNSLSLASGSVLRANGGNGSAGGVIGSGGGYGGGGGGGGYIVLNSFATTDSSTKTVSAGAAGGNVGSAPFADGGGGGAFGGNSGYGGSNGGSLVPIAGSSGQILTNQFI